MEIKYAIARFFSRLKPNAVKNSVIDKTARIGHGAQLVDCSVSRYTYFGNAVTAVKTEIGSFCSIAGGTTIGGGGHPLNFVSTSPVFCKGGNVLKTNFAGHPYDPYKKTEIGHDVWIGARALVKAGVKIGTGAVVGMGSVVTKDVPPYAIVAGNPARIVRMRFDDRTIGRLLYSRWWEMSETDLKKYGEFMADPETFLDVFEKEKQSEGNGQ